MPLTSGAGRGRSSTLMLRSWMLLVALGALGACTPAVPETEPPADPGDSMQRFVAALHGNDTAAFAALFPRRKPWHYVGTLTTPNGVSVIEPGVLARDLAAREGLYELLFYADGDDTFRDYVEMTAGAEWQRSGEHRFSPPGLPDLGGSVYVQWRREGKRWVVDTIAGPGS